MSSFSGHFCAFLKDEPQNILWERKNVEVIVGGWLLAWVMASNQLAESAVGGSSALVVPDAPIWGLAIGNADQTVIANQVGSDDKKKLRRTLLQELFRKKASFVYFLDPSLYLPTNPSAIPQKIPVSYITPYLEIQTIFNSNTDVKLQTQPLITEMGLVGGSTQVSTAAINDLGQGNGPVNQPNCGILLDYVTPEPFKIPMARDFVVSLILDFTH